MESFVKYVLLVMTGVCLAALLNIPGCVGKVPAQESVKKIVYVDTVRSVAPVATRTVVLNPDTVKLRKVSRVWRPPVYFSERDKASDVTEAIGEEKESSEESEDSDEYDNVEVIVPIEQRMYEDSMYMAWVSGYRAQLDSINVYPRREVVTVMPKAKRWHIGPTVGYGMTPGGLQPYVGISVTYSLFSF